MHYTITIFKTHLHKLLFLILIIFSLVPYAQAQVPQKPNIIFILADDVGYYVPAINGGESYLTPHIDSMARHGMNFKNCDSKEFRHGNSSLSQFLSETTGYC